MRFALVDELRAEPAPCLRGECCLCGDDMIAKCGRYVRWHWAHRARIACDPWQELETDWHRNWKNAFSTDCQEVVHVDDRTHEKHIADVKTPGGFVVEVQHSPIGELEALSRERFYKNMIWIVDARHLVGRFYQGMAHDLASCSPMMYQIKWRGTSRVLEKWSNSGVHVYFDAMNSATEHEGDDDKLWFLPRETVVPVQNRVLWRLLEFNAADKSGYIAPVRAEAIIESVMDGTYPPLHECEEESAWRYRRECREVAGHVDERGNRMPTEKSRSRLSISSKIPERTNAEIDQDDLPF